jgi:glycosyltransferase involved in cell wall biosynthesis
MHILIEASNISEEGGGLRHLQSLLKFNKDFQDKIKITIYSTSKTLNKINDYPYLEKKSINKIFHSTYILRLIWQFFFLNKKKLINYNLLIVLGGIYVSNFQPTITLCQNLVPFSFDQYRKYNFLKKIKLYIQSLLLSYSFNNSVSNLFMTNASRNIIEDNGFKLNRPFKVIHHGHNIKYEHCKKNNNFNKNNPFKILYVSRLEEYKNHLLLINSVKKLIKKNYNIELTLIFSETSININKISKKLFINLLDDKNIKIQFGLSSIELSHYYKKSHCFFFPSECETFGIPLIEAAAYSLPIACTNNAVFKEILGDAPEYFEPNIDSICNYIKKFYNDTNYLYSKSLLSYNQSKKYDWDKSISLYYSYFFEVIENEEKKNFNNST